MTISIGLYKTESGRSPVEHFISELSKVDQARFAEVHHGVEQYRLGSPRLRFRKLRGRLWEIKFNSVSAGYRIIYLTLESGVMIWLHVFKKKTQKTPLGDLEIAEKRMKEVLDHET